MNTIRIPRQLADAVDADGIPARHQWLSELPGQVIQVAAEWELELVDPFLPSGQCAWVAPARSRTGDELVLKVAWRHREAEHEAEGLQHWNGDGAVHCYAARQLNNTTAQLLERCRPGRQLGKSVPEPEQDEIISSLLRRLWARAPQPGHPFTTLEETSAFWADEFELAFDRDSRGLDTGLAGEGIEIFRRLPASAASEVLLCVDLHAGNVLAAQREPWLVIDPKPLTGDPGFDPVQHMLNCDARLHADPLDLAQRMAALLDLDAQRVSQWLFARCVQESLGCPTIRDVARRLAP